MRLMAVAALACCAALLPSLAPGGTQRSYATKRQFQQTHPCPSTGRTSGACPGYVKDHVVPLACGGPDAVSKLQWQTKAAAKAKDKWERRGCAR